MARAPDERAIHGEPGSITRNLAQLGASDDGLRNAAAHHIWERYVHELARFVSRRLKDSIRQREDENDVLQDAFNSFFRREREGQFDLQNRSDLKALLITITNAKVCDTANRHTTEKRNVDREVASGPSSETGDTFDPIQHLPADDVSFEETVAVAEELKFLLDMLPDELKQIAIWRMDGQSHEAIGRRLGMTKWAVIDRVEKIRNKWSGALESD